MKSAHGLQTEFNALSRATDRDPDVLVTLVLHRDDVHGDRLSDALHTVPEAEQAMQHHGRDFNDLRLVPAINPESGVIVVTNAPPDALPCSTPSGARFRGCFVHLGLPIFTQA